MESPFPFYSEEQLAERERRICSLNGKFYGFVAFMLINIVGIYICGGIAAERGLRTAVLVCAGIALFALIVGLIFVARYKGRRNIGNHNLRGLLALLLCCVLGTVAICSFSEEISETTLAKGAAVELIIGGIIWAIISASYRDLPPEEH